MKREGCSCIMDKKISLITDDTYTMDAMAMGEETSHLLTGSHVEMQSEPITIDEAAALLEQQGEFLLFIRMRMEQLEKINAQLEQDPIGELATVGSPERTVGDKLEQIHENQTSYRENIKAEFYRLRLFEYKINRANACLNALAPAEYLLLNRMYIKKEKWENLIYEMEISRTTLSIMRKNALQSLADMYNSQLSMRQLQQIALDVLSGNALTVMSGRKKRKKQKMAVSEGHQVTISELITGSMN